MSVSVVEPQELQELQVAEGKQGGARPEFDQ